MKFLWFDKILLIRLESGELFQCSICNTCGNMTFVFCKRPGHQIYRCQKEHQGEAEGFTKALSGPQLKHRQESVHRSQNSSARKTRLRINRSLWQRKNGPKSLKQEAKDSLAGYNQSNYKLWCLLNRLLLNTDHTGDSKFCFKIFSFLLFWNCRTGTFLKVI